MTAGGTYAKAIRLQAVWKRIWSSAVEDDVMITTHDFRILDTVWPDAGATGDTHNYASLEASLATFWGSIRSLYQPVVRLDEYRWYRNDGGDRTWGEPARVQTIASPLAGSSTSSVMPPPQVACTVTELTDSRRHWGRFYLPTPSVVALTGDGRLTAGAVATIAAAAQTLYNSWNTKGVRCIVAGSVPLDYVAAVMPSTSWIGEQFERSIGRNATDQRIAVAYDVTKIRVDDVLDVQRRRRYGVAAVRDTRVVT